METDLSYRKNVQYGNCSLVQEERAVWKLFSRTGRTCGMETVLSYRKNVQYGNCSLVQEERAVWKLFSRTGRTCGMETAPTMPVLFC
jgi:beta-lactamase class D